MFNHINHTKTNGDSGTLKYKFKLRKCVARCCFDSRLRGAISERLDLQTQQDVNISRAERAIAARLATTCGLLDLLLKAGKCKFTFQSRLIQM